MDNNNQTQRLHLFSWNVAGWSTTAAQIDRHYNTFTNYFRNRHKADIVCLQEMKVTRKKLEEMVGDHSNKTTASIFDDWDSCWSCCEDDSKKGYSGVTTFAPKNTILRATSKVFSLIGAPELDKEGRCVVTLHKNGGLCVFNVYVPNAGHNGERQPVKLKFLASLVEAMKHVKATWEGVQNIVLAGDMNASRRPEDVHWTYRTLSKHQLRQKQLCDLLSSPDDRLLVGVLEKNFMVGGNHSNNNNEEDGEEDGFLDLEAASKAAHRFNIDPLQLRTFSEQHCGLPPGKESTHSVFFTPMETDSSLQMIDTFTFCHDTASTKDRFTCWDQYRNRRYENVGTRIDFIYFSNNGNNNNNNSGNCWKVCRGADLPGSGDAKSAATSGGLWQPAPMDGSGLIEASLEVYNTQFTTPHTGMVYTPPKYSDHIAVTLLLEREEDQNISSNNNNKYDVATVQCMPPKRKQSRLTSFFTVRKESSDACSAASQNKDTTISSSGVAVAAGDGSSKRRRDDGDDNEQNVNDCVV
eukprot:PhM_4_TR11565/c0_g1_i1/m.85574